MYKDENAPVEDRITDLLGRMTLDEKILLLSGDRKTGFSTNPVERLGIPVMYMTDGPHGVRTGKATAFPPGVTLGSTWNEDLLEEVGAAIGRETLAKDRHVILGPCINIHRVPFGGRNFESYSEDPYLAGRLAVGYVKGVQGQNAVATPKHYAVNNQEWERFMISAEISERALREIYLPHFRDAVVEGGAWAVMCSYNRLNGVYACENKHLLQEILKDEWGFEGFVVSDWGAVHSTVGTAMSGMDIEMPNGKYMREDLKEAVEAGDVPEDVIDDKVRRLVRVMMKTGLFDGKIEYEKDWVDSPEHRQVALQVAREGIVLLKNENGALPLDRKEIKTLAVIGPNANVAQMGGGGSSWVTPTHSISPLEGIMALAGGGVEIKYATGCDLAVPVRYDVIPPGNLVPEGGDGTGQGMKAEYFTDKNMAGDPLLERVDRAVDFNWGTADELPEGLNVDNFGVRWRGTLVPEETGKYKLVVVSNDGVAKLYFNNRPVVNIWAFDGKHQGKDAKVKLKAGEKYDVRLEFQGMGNRSMIKLGWVRQGQDPIKRAAEMAAGSDAAVVFIGLDRSIEGEGHDRDSIELPGLQDELVAAVTEANPRTAVVMVNGTPLVMDRWLDSAAAVVEAWYPGQEGGTAIAEILFGEVNPSGKLPTTLLKSWEQSPAYGNYPGSDGKVHYEEGIYVGYRYFDTEKIDPQFPFGHGLSYTTFEYSDMEISPRKTGADGKVRVSLKVKNTGEMAGMEVVQLYLRDVESSVDRPVHELKGIEKIALAPGETGEVSFELGRRAFSFFHPDRNEWTVEPGEFEAQAAASSRDIRLTGTFEIE